MRFQQLVQTVLRERFVDEGLHERITLTNRGSAVADAVLEIEVAADFAAMLGIRGAVAVWAFYSARLLIGFLVGITSWPGRWFLRGPLCGVIAMFPVTVIALATPGCGPP